MPMPSTRRGRYLHYRAKALRRKRNQEQRKPSPTARRKHKSCRCKDAFGWEKQMDASPKQNAEPPREPGFWTVPATAIKPEKAVWGVKPSVVRVDYSISPQNHFREAEIGYQFRRVQSIPPMSFLAWMPYLQPRELLVREDCWLGEFYPSGRRSYASLQGWV